MIIYLLTYVNRPHILFKVVPFLPFLCSGTLLKGNASCYTQGKIKKPYNIKVKFLNSFFFFHMAFLFKNKKNKIRFKNGNKKLGIDFES